MSRIILIGDVHGCRAELDALMERLIPTRGDRVIFLGDLGDKGPDSLGVIACAREVVQAFVGSKVVMGNHEQNALLARAKGKYDRAEPWVRAMTEADVEFLASMPLYVKIPEYTALAVHGGLFPAFFEKHGALPDEAPPALKGGGKVAERARRFLRVRTVSAAGDMVGLGEETPESRRWSLAYDGREGHVYYGHAPELSGLARLDEHATGLDTACVFGGRLTACVLDGAHKGFVQVPARCRYAEPYGGEE